MKFIFKYQDLDKNKNIIMKQFIIDAINQQDFEIIKLIHEEILKDFPVRTLYKKQDRYIINTEETMLLKNYMPNLDIRTSDNLHYITEDQFISLVLYMFNKIGSKYNITFTKSEIPEIECGLMYRLLDVYKK